MPFLWRVSLAPSRAEQWATAGVVPSPRTLRLVAFELCPPLGGCELLRVIFCSDTSFHFLERDCWVPGKFRGDARLGRGGGHAVVSIYKRSLNAHVEPQ